MTRPGKCNLCPEWGQRTLVKRGYRRQQIKVCDKCLRTLVAWFYTRRRIKGKEAADPRQMFLL